MPPAAMTMNAIAATATAMNMNRRVRRRVSSVALGGVIVVIGIVVIVALGSWDVVASWSQEPGANSQEPADVIVIPRVQSRIVDLAIARRVSHRTRITPWL